MSRLMQVCSAAIVAAAFAGCASMWQPIHAVQAKEGVLTNPSGMTLYTFDKDAAGSGKSVCNGPCAANWPPLMAAADSKATGDYTIITRDDGGRQWAYKGKPLYLWVKDTKPGEKTGDGFINAWRVARP